MKRSLRFILYFIVIIGVLYIAWLAYRGTEGFQASNPAARPSRLASSGATPCNDYEEQIMNRCYRPCPGGQNPTGDRTTCPVKRQSMSANPICPSGYTYDVGAGMCIKDACDPDPDTGQEYTRGIDANRRPVCNATKRNKRSSSVGSYTPASFSCYNNGSIPIRYIRIRPMTTSKTNKICINNIQVWDDEMKIVKALTANASDGTCILNPIGFPDANCQSGKPFTSGNKYDSDTDGGMKNRAANSFWVLDLGSVVTVKKIEITQCSVRSPETTPVDGLRLEVFKELGGLDSTPLASRVLGQDSIYTVIFDFSRYDSYSEACFDVCPSMGTVESQTDAASNTCIVATDGITKRSISEPMVISQAVKLPCNSQYLRADAQNNLPARIVSNMIQNPANVNECITCDAFPNTRMYTTDTYSYTVDTTTKSIQQISNNTAITFHGSSFTKADYARYCNNYKISYEGGLPDIESYTRNWTGGHTNWQCTDYVFVYNSKDANFFGWCPKSIVPLRYERCGQGNRDITKQKSTAIPYYDNIKTGTAKIFNENGLEYNNPTKHICIQPIVMDPSSRCTTAYIPGTMVVAIFGTLTTLANVGNAVRNAINELAGWFGLPGETAHPVTVEPLARCEPTTPFRCPKNSVCIGSEEMPVCLNAIAALNVEIGGGRLTTATEEENGNGTWDNITD